MLEWLRDKRVGDLRDLIGRITGMVPRYRGLIRGAFPVQKDVAFLNWKLGADVFLKATQAISSETEDDRQESQLSTCVRKASRKQRRMLYVPFSLPGHANAVIIQLPWETDRTCRALIFEPDTGEMVEGKVAMEKQLRAVVVASIKRAYGPSQEVTVHLSRDLVRRPPQEQCQTFMGKGTCKLWSLYTAYCVARAVLGGQDWAAPGYLQGALLGGDSDRRFEEFAWSYVAYGYLYLAGPAWSQSARSREAIEEAVRTSLRIAPDESAASRFDEILTLSEKVDTTELDALLTRWPELANASVHDSSPILLVIAAGAEFESPEKRKDARAVIRALRGHGGRLTKPEEGELLVGKDPWIRQYLRRLGLSEIDVS